MGDGLALPDLAEHDSDDDDVQYHRRELHNLQENPNLIRIMFNEGNGHMIPVIVLDDRFRARVGYLPPLPDNPRNTTAITYMFAPGDEG